MARATARPTAVFSHPPPVEARKAEKGLSAPRSAFRSAAPTSTASTGTNTVSTLIRPAQRMVRATSLGASCISSAKYTALPKPL